MTKLMKFCKGDRTEWLAQKHTGYKWPLYLYDKYVLDKHESFYDLPKEEQERVLEWIREGLTPIKTINSKHTSYGMKHWFQYSPLGFYLTNEQFKEAMLEAGFDMVIHPDNFPNAWFNYSEKSPAVMAQTSEYYYSRQLREIRQRFIDKWGRK